MKKTAPRWWSLNPRDMPGAVHSIVDRLAEDGRRSLYMAFESMYAAPTLSAATSTVIATIFGRSDVGAVWQRTPVIRSLIDTQMNRIGRSRPRPWPVTFAGDWEMQRKAELLKLWLDGQFERLSMDDLARKALLDGLVLGTGALKTLERNGLPCVECVWPGNLHVNKREEKYQCVRTLYQTIPMDREVAISTWPEFEAELGEADEYEDPLVPAEHDDDVSSDLILIVEAWRLPTGTDADNVPTGGKHVICTSKTVLNPDSMDWKRDSFPFSFFRYREKSRSFWGMGIVESAGCMQGDLNTLDAVLSDSYSLMTPAIMVQKGSVPKAAYTNEVGRVIEYEGAPPQPWTPNAVSPDFLQRGAELENRMLRLEGISTFSAQSQKPAGLNSGVAITAHEDLESERHALPGQHFENLHIDTARLLITEAEDIADDDSIDDSKKLAVLGGKETLELVSYSDARMKSDEYVLRVWPVSRLSRSATGRLEQVSQMTEMGVFSEPEEILEILDMPDTQANANLRLAGRKLVRKMVDNALKSKRAFVHPHMPLEYLVKYGTMRRCEAELEGAPDSGLIRLDELIATALEELKKLAPPPAPAMPPMDPSMMGGGMPPLPPGMPPGMPPGPPMMPPAGPSPGMVPLQ